MMADVLVTNIAQLVSPAGHGAARGHAMRELCVTADAAIAIRRGRVRWCGPRAEFAGEAATTVDAGGCAVVPALVDPHTHLIWGGDRLADFEARASGVGYETILARGGGIRHTVAATRATGVAQLRRDARARIARMMQAGAAIIEVKSGYGDTWEGERRQLEVILLLRADTRARIEPTMLFHLPPRDPAHRDEYIAQAIAEWIPSLARDGAATAVDVFIERDAFSVADADALLGAARVSGLAVKAHVDQFSALGGLELALRHGALSVDHLEASGAAQVAALAASATVGVILPGVTLHLGIPAAPARAFIDAGATVAIGTDCNPGSSPLVSMALAMALAVRLNGLTPAEALTACTANAAAALGITDAGRIAPGMAADFLLLRSDDWRDMPYTLGEDVVERVIIAGNEMH